MKKQEGEIEEILGIPEKEEIVKETRLQHNGKQYEIRIPMLLIDELNLKKGDKVVIKYNTKTKEYSIRFKKNEKEKTNASNR